MKLSIITPSYNQGEFIERTIQSVLSQHVDLEYWVIDGGSTDNTAEIVKRYEDKLFFVSEPDKGQSHAVNKGLARATGDIIGWLNSDDVYSAESLTYVDMFFQKNPDIDVLYGDAYLIDRHDNRVGFYPTEPWNVNRLKNYCYLSQPATFFRRSLLAKHGFLDESLHFCMDYEYWLRLACNQVNFAYFPQILAKARIYAETKSSQQALAASKEVIEVFQKKFNYIPNSKLLSHAGAKAKTEQDLHYPQLRFILAVWKNIWSTTGLYYKGFERIKKWVAVQLAMIQEFSIRRVSVLAKKWRN